MFGSFKVGAVNRGRRRAPASRVDSVAAVR